MRSDGHVLMVGRLALVLTLLALSAPGHEGLKEAARLLTVRIETEGPRVELFLERGRVLRQSGDWVAAVQDFRSAEKLDRESYGVELAFAELFAELRNWEVAEEYAESHLARFPQDVAGSRVLAQVFEGEGRFAEAVELYGSVRTRLERPGPELFLALARALSSSGNTVGAIEALDDGLSLLGQVPALQLAAIELERERSALDQAIARVELLAARAARKEHWLVLRGEIELEGLRPIEARRSVNAARLAIESLRPAQRTTSSTAELLRRLADLDARTAQLEQRPSEPELPKAAR